MSKKDEAKEVELNTDKGSKNEERKSKKQRREIEKLSQQVEQLTQDVQRERADFANYRRRAENEKQLAKEAAKADLLADMLPVIDDLERALSHQPKELDGDPWVQGVGKVHEQLQQTLSKLGIDKIVAEGATFDPNLHDAVGYEGESEDEEEVVVEELRAGYMLGENVLRPSMVRVGSSQEKQDDNNDKKEEDK